MVKQKTLGARVRIHGIEPTNENSYLNGLTGIIIPPFGYWEHRTDYFGIRFDPPDQTTVIGTKACGKACVHVSNVEVV
jgi:hypothetical protein